MLYQLLYLCSGFWSSLLPVSSLRLMWLFVFLFLTSVPSKYNKSYNCFNMTDLKDLVKVDYMSGAGQESTAWGRRYVYASDMSLKLCWNVSSRFHVWTRVWTGFIVLHVFRVCSFLPVMAELVKWWRRIAGDVGILYRHWQRRPGEQLLVLCQTAAEGLTGSDGLQRDWEKKTGR